MRHLLPAIVGFLGTAALSASAHAQPQIDLLEPSGDACVNAGLGIVEGQPPGGHDPELLPDVPLQLRLQEPNGRAIEIVVQVGGAEVFRTVVEPPSDQAFETNQVFIPGDAVADGVGQTLRVVATVAGQSAADQVVVDFDRVAPRVAFAEASLDQIESCFAQPPALNYQVTDAVDANPEVRTSTEIDGCRVEQIIEVADACGNGQRVRFATRQAPQGAVTPLIQGVDEGAEVVSATVFWRVEQPNDCVITERAELLRDGESAGGFISGRRIDDAGAYEATVSVTVCGDDQPIEATRRWTVLPRPHAVYGGPYETTEGAELVLDGSGSEVDGAFGAIAEYAWDLDGDNVFAPNEPTGAQVPFDTLQGDGVYRIGLRITTEDGYVEYDYGQVTLLDVQPTCDAGGPYEVEQGRATHIDGSGSSPGHASEPILFYDWAFGDGRFPQRSLDTEPVHHYVDEGDWTVTLTIGDRDSDVDCQTTVHVIDVSPEVRDAGLDQGQGEVFLEGDLLRFTAGQTSSGSAAEPIINFHWSFGDGATQDGLDERGPLHMYDDDGTFEACLRVEDQDSADEACFPVVVTDLQPVARLFGPVFADEGEAVTFSAIGSRAGGDADLLSHYVFNFGDGSPPVEVHDLAQTEIEHVFTADGPMVVTLEVHDEDSFEIATREIFVGDAVPEAVLNIRAGVTVPEGTEISLDSVGSAPGAPSDPIVRYEWIFGDGDRAQGDDLTEVRHAWPDEGSYLVRLTVVDADGSRSSREHRLVVTNLPPQNVAIAGPAELEVGERGTWLLSYRDAAGDTPAIQWRTGDGRLVRNRAELSHAYPAPGFYEQVVTVDDGDGGVTQARLSVLVTAAAPRLAGPTELEGQEGTLLAFEISTAPARLEGGALDGPLALHVVRAPAGLEWTIDEAPEAADGATLNFTWTPGPTDAGTHLVRVLARAPSGIERTHEVRVIVTETGEARLVASSPGGRVAVYRWRADALRGQTIFEPMTDTAVGHLRSLVVDAARGLALGASPDTGKVVVIDLRSGHVVRQAPCVEAPTALALGPDHAFSFDTSGRLSALDLDALKPAGQSRDDLYRGVVDALWLRAGDAGLEQDRLVALTAQGDLLIIDPEAALDRQVAYERIELGGSANRMVLDAGRLRIARRRPADVLTVDVARALAGDDDAITSRALVFAAHDLAVAAGGLWMATGRGVEWLPQAGDPVTRVFGAADGVVALPDQMYGEPAFAAGLGNRVEIFGADGRVLDAGRNGGGVRLGFVILP